MDGLMRDGNGGSLGLEQDSAAGPQPNRTCASAPAMDDPACSGLGSA